MYLDHTFARRLSLSEITSLFGLSRYLDRTFAQRIGSVKVKSKNEVTHCRLLPVMCSLQLGEVFQEQLIKPTNGFQLFLSSISYYRCHSIFRFEHQTLFGTLFRVRDAPRVLSSE